MWTCRAGPLGSPRRRQTLASPAADAGMEPRARAPSFLSPHPPISRKASLTDQMLGKGEAVDAVHSVRRRRAAKGPGRGRGTVASTGESRASGVSMAGVDSENSKHLLAGVSTCALPKRATCLRIQSGNQQPSLLSVGIMMLHSKRPGSSRAYSNKQLLGHGCLGWCIRT